MPYIFDELERVSDYPLDLILNHMSMIDRPDYPYLLSRKYLKNQELAGEFGKKLRFIFMSFMWTSWKNF